MLLLDANILIRAVLGTRVFEILRTYSNVVRFLVTDVAASEAREHLPVICRKRATDPEMALAILNGILEKIEILDAGTYRDLESEAKELISERDEDDWPTLASALALGCPIWTEDLDFFGLGVPIWKSSRVEFLLKRRSAQN